MAAVKRLASDTAVKKATGKTWKQWFKIIDSAKDIDKTNHKQVASWLYDNHLKNSWWVQSITVGYEYEKGLRVLGETKGAGFQVGVQKTVSKEPEAVWKFLMSKRGQNIWLGDALNFKPLTGYGYRTRGGISGEIRTVKLGQKLRLSWKRPHWRTPSTLQITLLPVGDKTAVHFHHEKLADSKQRAEMKKHWQEVLDKLDKTF